jgi:ABC-type uncharacterized transport system permease subunit
MLPVTVISIITIAYTFIFIIKQLKTEKWKYYLKTIYFSVFFLLLLFFLIRNTTYVFNECEKNALYTIANSKENIVALENDCPVVSWEPLYTPKESKNYGTLLYLWNITNTEKLFIIMRHK